MKTSEMTGSALDWSVAKCWYGEDYDMSIPLFDDGLIFAPSTNWAHGGPIIERESISIERKHDGWWMASCKYHYADDPMYLVLGDTPLIAAMRCYVASKLGDNITIPEALQ